jgi:NACHT domain-containing protein
VTKLAVVYRRRQVAVTAAALAAVGLLVWASVRWEIGDIDPVGALIGLTSLLFGVAVWSADRRRPGGDPTAIAAALSGTVLVREQQARRQLLGATGRAINLEFTVRPSPSQNATVKARRGNLDTVARYYQQVKPGRMVITGDAGAGKTVLAVDLILTLLQHRRPEDPVPVRIPAASWDDRQDAEQQPGDGLVLHRWLVRQLTSTFTMSAASAWTLVNAGMILPVIDGLDELADSDGPGFTARAATVMRLINDYQRFRDRGPLIVTCRTVHYETLIGSWWWVQDAARVEIAPVGPSRMREFITGMVLDTGRWKDVLDQIRRDGKGVLAVALATPWRLSVAAAVYEQRDDLGAFVRDPKDLTAAELDTSEKIRDHLMDLLVPAAVAAAGGRAPDPQNVRSWLTVLAAYLNNNAVVPMVVGGRTLSASDLVPLDLWPIAGRWRARAMVLVLLAGTWAVGGPAQLYYIPHYWYSGRVTDMVCLGAVVCFLAGMSWWKVWPKPLRLNSRRLTQRRRLLQAVLFPPVLGVEFLLLAHLGDESVQTSVWFALIGTGGAYLFFTALAALAEGDEIGVRRPSSAFRETFGGGAFVMGILACLLGVNYGLANGPAFGIVYGITMFLTFTITGPVGGGAAWRYIALLLCTRKRSGFWLPWRLVRFLEYCCRTGLLRVAGSGYQFRHRELQDFLAR